jgi:lycopene beta-cyclase
MMQPRDIDIAILGGGLAGGLIAFVLQMQRPELRYVLIEDGPRFGGNHVWSFFQTDIDQRNRWITDHFVVAEWEGHDVHFPGHSRHLRTPYASVTGERFDKVLRQCLPEEALLSCTKAVSATRDTVTLADGRVLSAGGVIDARGASGLPYMAGGWQKFVGRMLRLSAPHGLSRPIVMDARVEQRDGYRFVYCLPFSETEVFVEDTYYSDTPALDMPELGRRIEVYAAAQGWRIVEVKREETGVLPVIAAGDFEAFWRSGGDLAKAGARAALVHPLTSYSLPAAVRFAVHLSTLNDVSGASLARASYAWARAHWRQGSFYRMLARMLFGAAAPEARYKLLERFYRLPEPLIERFYAGRSTGLDKLRVLAGKPPVPIGLALASLAGGGRPLSPLERV